MRLERFRVIVVCILTAVVVACSSDGGSSGSPGTPPAATPLTGIFLDSPVQGLGYSTTPSGLSGITDANGQFTYNPNNTVTFSLYGRTIGTPVPAAPVVTVLSVFNATSLTDSRVLNLSQLLLTLGGMPSGSNPLPYPQHPRQTFHRRWISQLQTLTHRSLDSHSLQRLMRRRTCRKILPPYRSHWPAAAAEVPAGINCGTVCTAAYIKGSSITLTAMGVGFTGWSGGGWSGAGACVVTLNANTTITATFGTSLPTMTIPRAAHAAVRLTNGQVILTGGISESVFPNPAINTAELFDPTTKTFTALNASLQSPRINHTATLLPDGKVLLTGGQIDNLNGNGNDSAELYDPATQTFTAISAKMTSSRSDSPASDLLPNGKVLIAGGQRSSNGGVILNNAELYDPTTQTFEALTSTMTSIRAGHTATLLSTGKVLLTGGYDFLSSTNPPTANTLNSMELYDPTAQTFTAITATMETPRTFHEATALADGTVLLTGGITAVPSKPYVVLNTVETYRP